MRADYVVEEQEVIDLLLAPRIMELMREQFPEFINADELEAFQVKVTWID
jgi:hypothetical protein